MPEKKAEKNKYIQKKAIVIVGTTASGKTGLAVDLACKLGGEIVSADSRQVYRYMDIGTGKDLSEYKVKNYSAGSAVLESRKNKSEEIDIPYHLIDVVHPNERYDLARWLKNTRAVIDDIHKRGRIPIIAGGTGLYAQALVDNFNLSEYGEDKELRKALEEKDSQELFADLFDLNEIFAEKLNNSEKHNKRRLIRYIELIKQGEVVKDKNLKPDSEWEYLILGMNWPRDILLERISKRLVLRLENEGMVAEVERLHEMHKISWERLESFGLENKFISQYLQKKLEYPEMVEKLRIAIGQFAKRQMTWLRRWEKQGALIHWLDDVKKAEKLAKKFLK